jgi:D-alanyl-D-alanine carboxypeptidase
LPPPSPTPYSVDITSGELEALPLISPTGLAGAGAMTSTLDDLQTWGAALGDGRLMGAELQTMRVERSRVVTNGPEYDRYGLGIGILKDWLDHTGAALDGSLPRVTIPRSRAAIAVGSRRRPAAAANFARESSRRSPT